MLTWADVHLNYKGEHIAGRSVPLDNVAVRMDLVDGRITTVIDHRVADLSGRALAHAEDASPPRPFPLTEQKKLLTCELDHTSLADAGIF